MDTQSIPDAEKKVKPTKKNNPRKMKYLPRTTVRLFSLLKGDCRMREKHDTLHVNGSFFGDNKRYAQELEVTIRTIIRAKQRLAAAKLIKYVTPQGQGMATIYWITSKEHTNPRKKNNRKDTADTNLPETIRAYARLFGKNPTIDTFSKRNIPKADILSYLENA